MLNDLKAQLEPVGRLEALSGVADEAIAYYDNQDTDKLDCEAAVRSAHAFHLKTQIHLNRNELDQTSASAQRALDLIKAKKAECGNIPEFMVADGHSEYWAASPIWRRIAAVELGEKVGIREYRELLESLIPFYERYEAAILPLAELPEHAQLYAQEAADIAVNFGSVHFYLGRFDKTDFELSVRHFEKAIEESQKIALVNGELPSSASQLPETKTALFTLANAYGWHARAAEAALAFKRALASRVEESRIMNQLANAAPGKVDFPALAQALQAEIAILRLRSKMKDPTLSVEDFDDLETRIVQLSASDPSNETWGNLVTRIRNLHDYYQPIYSP